MPKNTKQSRQRTWMRTALLIAALTFALAGVEAALRLWNLYTPPPYPPVSSRGRLFERFDPHGYRLRPSRVATYSFPQSNPRTLTMSSNRHGFRGRRELDERDDRARVIVLGDSMVFGQGVEEDERFTEVLESIEPRWRVDNMGMTGFGPDLMLRALEEVGLGLNPSVVVLCMYTDDFRRVHPQNAGIGFPIPRYTLRSGRLVTIPYPEPQPWQRLHLGMLVQHAYWRVSSIETNLNAAIFDRFLMHSKDRRFALVIVFLPATADTPADKKRRVWLNEYSRRRNAPFLDLTDPILGAKEPVFIRGDYHFNPEGHKVVAESLQRFLGREVLHAR